MRVALIAVAAALLLVPSTSAARLGGALVALVTAESQNDLLAVSLPAGTVVRRVPVAPDPENVAAEDKGPTVVVSAQSHSVTVLAWHSLRVLKVFRQFRDPHLAAIAPDGEWAYVTDDGSGILSVIELARLRIVDRVFVGAGAHHLSFRPDQRRLWVALGEHARQIVVLDTSNPRRPRVVTRFDPGFPAHDLSFSPDGSRVWVTSDTDSLVRVVSAETARVLFTVPGGTPPQHVAFGRNGTAYVTSGYGSTIELVDARTGRVVRRVSAPYGSFNVTTVAGVVLTSSLLRGTVTEFDYKLRLLRTVKVAAAARDVAGAVWP